MKTPVSEVMPWPLPAVLIALGSCLAIACPSPTTHQSGADPPGHYLIYLHGRIVQEQGPRAISERFGPYQFEAIVVALRRAGAEVVAPLRSPGSNLHQSAAEVTERVGALMAQGIAADRITLVGASQGSVIAMLASQELALDQLGLVLMGACNGWVTGELQPDLHGRVLSLYEPGDRHGGSCRELVEQSSGVTAFEEIRLDTRLDHGFLYRPLEEWVDPATDWALKGVRERGRELSG
ncbi:MAG: hypothetical protein AAF604_07775 [Acidobacteriota bacterium]